MNKYPRCNSRYIGSTYRYWEKRLEEHLHMSALMGKPLKRLQSFAPILHVKGKCCINNSSDDFRIIGKEKDRHLIRLKESIFINHFKPSWNTRETNGELVLFRQLFYDILRQYIQSSCLCCLFFKKLLQHFDV